MSPESADRLFDPAALVRELDANGAEEFNRRVLALPRSRRQELAGRLSEEAVQRGITIEYDGVRKPIHVTLRPRLLTLTCRGYVHHVTWQIRCGLRRLTRILRDDPRARELFPLGALEAEWLERYRRTDLRPGHLFSERIFCRLDALARFDGAGWRETLRFVEPNVVGVGGMRYSPAAEQLLLDSVIPAILDPEEDLVVDTNFDPRWLLVDELEQHARVLGVTEKPTLAFVDDKRLYRYGGEFAHLVPYFREHGVDAVYADPRELELSAEGHVTFEGRRVHVVYRFLELRELADLEAEGHDLRAIHAAFAQGLVVPTAGGDLEHKSAFEVLTSPLFSWAFTEEQRKIFDDHVLWTRLVFDRRTTDPGGDEVDLPRYLLTHRARLVLKPNRAYGGDGVLIGECTSEAEWTAAAERALAEPHGWVVQEVSPPDVEPFPIVDDDGHAELVPRYAAVGFFPGRKGLGVFGRVSASRVVNINTGGGISPFLVNVT